VIEADKLGPHQILRQFLRIDFLGKRSARAEAVAPSGLGSMISGPVDESCKSMKGDAKCKSLFPSGVPVCAAISNHDGIAAAAETMLALFRKPLRFIIDSCPNEHMNVRFLRMKGLQQT